MQMPLTKAKSSKTRKPRPSKTIPLADVVQGFTASAPQAVDTAALRKMTGDARLRTLPEVAATFGVSANTVGQSWRQNEMPGEPSNYSVAAILEWWIQRSRRDASRTGKPLDPIDERLREIELRKAELELADKERKEKLSLQLLCDPSDILAAVKQLVAMASEALAQVPRNIEPYLPRESADEITAQLKRDIERCLQSLADGSYRAAGATQNEEKCE